MSTSPSDRQPLLPSHVNRQHSHRLSTPQISFPSSSSSAFSGESDTTIKPSSSSVPDLSPGRRQRRDRQSGNEERGLQGGERQGVPKLSRECLWSEIKCYGSYILPTFLVFGVLVVGAGLIAVGWKKGWFQHEKDDPQSLI